MEPEQETLSMLHHAMLGNSITDGQNYGCDMLLKAIISLLNEAKQHTSLPYGSEKCSATEEKQNKMKKKKKSSAQQKLGLWVKHIIGCWNGAKHRGNASLWHWETPCKRKKEKQYTTHCKKWARDMSG